MVTKQTITIHEKGLLEAKRRKRQNERWEDYMRRISSAPPITEFNFISIVNLNRINDEIGAIQKVEYDTDASTTITIPEDSFKYCSDSKEEINRVSDRHLTWNDYLRLCGRFPPLDEVGLVEALDEYMSEIEEDDI
jgi:hypothetical protein